MTASTSTKLRIEKAGSFNEAKVLRAAGKVSFTGPRGTITMDEEHHAPLTMYLGQVQSDGSVKVIQTFRTSIWASQCPKLKSKSGVRLAMAIRLRHRHDGKHPLCRRRRPAHRVWRARRSSTSPMAGS